MRCPRFRQVFIQYIQSSYENSNDIPYPILKMAVIPMFTEVKSNNDNTIFIWGGLPLVVNFPTR
jgi:hypothetical protein